MHLGSARVHATRIESACCLLALNADACATQKPRQAKTKTSIAPESRKKIDSAAEEHLVSAGWEGRNSRVDASQAPARAPKGFPFHVALPPPLFQSLVDEFLSPTSPDEDGRNERDGDVMRSGIKTRESCADSCSGSNVEETHAEQDSRDPLDGSSMFDTPSSLSSYSKQYLLQMASIGGQESQDSGTGSIARNAQSTQSVASDDRGGKRVYAAESEGRSAGTKLAPAQGAEAEDSICNSGNKERGSQVLMVMMMQSAGSDDILPAPHVMEIDQDLTVLRSLTDSFPPEGYVTHRRRCLCIVCVHNCVISVAIARL